MNRLNRSVVVLNILLLCQVILFFIISESNNVYVWGLNLKGQLGLHNSNKNVYHPKRIDYFENGGSQDSLLLKNEQII